MNTLIKIHSFGDIEVDLGADKSPLSYLFALSAILATHKQEFGDTPNNSINTFAVDDENLKIVDAKIGEIMEHLANVIASLGTMSVYLDREEVEGSDLDNLGWLICGLGELLGTLSGFQGHVTEALIQQASRGGRS